MAGELSIGDFAPDFTLDRDGGRNVTLSELRGKNVVVYFYPKDDTPGCTVEAKDFSSMKDEFAAENTVIIGISADDITSHDKFINKHDLNVILASDVEHSVAEAYGVWVEKNMYGKKKWGIRRDSFLINKEGIIKKIWKRVKVDGHAQNVLDTIKEGV